MPTLTLTLTPQQRATVRRRLARERNAYAYEAGDTAVLQALDLQILAAAETARDREREPTGTCRRCGCSAREPLDRGPGQACDEGCRWWDATLCTVCVTPDERRGRGARSAYAPQ